MRVRARAEVMRLREVLLRRDERGQGKKFLVRDQLPC
jgi:hypothetical protein